jgi:hypothetical protein
VLFKDTALPQQWYTLQPHPQGYKVAKRALMADPLAIGRIGVPVPSLLRLLALHFPSPFCTLYTRITHFDII